MARIAISGVEPKPIIMNGNTFQLYCAPNYTILQLNQILIQICYHICADHVNILYQSFHIFFLIWLAFRVFATTLGGDVAGLEPATQRIWPSDLHTTLNIGGLCMIRYIYYNDFHCKNPVKVPYRTSSTDDLDFSVSQTAFHALQDHRPICSPTNLLFRVREYLLTQLCDSG